MNEPKRVTNTRQQQADDPIGILGEMLFKGTTNMILDQEARGQRELIEVDVLPTDHGYRHEMVDVALSVAGILLGDVVRGDPLFQYATLPVGWTKRPTEHSMNSEVVDDKGRVRFGVFYKAAFYDRKAHLSATRRYTMFTYDSDEQETAYEAAGEGWAHVCDGSTEIKRFGPFTVTDAEVDARYPHRREDANMAFLAFMAAKNKAGVAAIAWLNEAYPKWEDPSAYWED